MLVFFQRLRHFCHRRHTEGMELAQAARSDAHAVARELMYRRKSMLGHPWSEWTMIVTNDQGCKVLSFLADEARS